MKKIVIGILFTVFLLSGCSTDIGSNDGVSEVTVSINGHNISCVGIESDDMANKSDFTDLTKSVDDLYYVSFDDSVELSFGFTPKEPVLKVYDRILENDGSDKYSDELTDVIEVPLNNNRGSFILKEHKAAMLSSDLKDYESGKTVRGFSFSVEYEEKNYLYMFAVRTDAGN